MQTYSSLDREEAGSLNNYSPEASSPYHYNNPNVSYWLFNSLRNQSYGMIEYDLSHNALLTTGKERENLKYLLTNFSYLKENWDGHGALAIPKQVINNALTLVNFIAVFNLLARVEITPKANGTISFAWETQNSEACIEVGKTRYSGFVKNDNENPSFFEGVFRTIGYELIGYIWSNLVSSSSLSNPITKIQIEE